jgi:hypothetical protein
MPKKKSKSKKTRKTTTRKQKVMDYDGDVCTTYKQALELFLTTPPETKSYTFSEESEEFMKRSIETINKIMPPKNKIKISKFKQLVRELYRHPTIKYGGTVTTRGKKTKTKKQEVDADGVDDHVDDDNELMAISFKMKSNVMDFQMVTSIVMLLFSIYLAYLVFVRYTELDNTLGLTGQGHIIMDSFKKALEANRRDNNLSFFMFLMKYFQSFGQNILEEEGRILIDLLKKTGETTTQNIMANIKDHCMNPDTMTDWMTSYLVPGSVSECISRVTENTTYKVLAEQGMIIAEIDKKKNDLVALARLSQGLGSTAVMSIFHKIGYLRNPPVYVANISRRNLMQIENK